MTREKFHAWLLRRWYGDRPIRVFIPLAALFAVLTAARFRAYRGGIFKIALLPVPVIVVGNITVGGTGKTPFVIWLTQALKSQGFQPGILTRGYGGESAHWPLPVTPATDPVLAGDEAVLLARHTGLPVMAGPDRVNAARRLLKEFPVNVIVSDDGLQHYRLPRALEIIMLDGRRGLGNCWRLPAGPLRESAARLDQADLVICKGDLPVNVSLPTGAPVMRMELGSAVNLADGTSRPLATFSGREVHAVAGIGHPEQFFAALEGHGLKVDSRALPDHAELSEADLRFDDDGPVLMTEKDAVKCRGFRLPNHWYVTASACFSDENTACILRLARKRLLAAGVVPDGVNSNIE
ncbi:MAG: tetraacyldisaccharide 4'-kinase [Gammaproteobacteria bacterium]